MVTTTRTRASPCAVMFVAATIVLAGAADARPPTMLAMLEGLSEGLGPPVQARDSASGKPSTLAALLPDPSNVFSPLSTAVYRVMSPVRDEKSLVIDGKSGMESIQGDGRGGFRVTFLLQGMEHKVHLGADDYGASSEFRGLFWKEVQGYESFMWAYTDSFNDAKRDDGSTEFSYFDANGFVNWMGDAEAGSGTTGISVYGVQTMPANLPPDAVYEGRLRGYLWYRDAPGFPDYFSSTNVRGELTLQADFSRNRVSGRIEGIRFAAPSKRNDYARLPAGNRILIASTGVDGSRFTGALNGRDTGSRPKLDRSVAGFEGHVFIEFYGPAAEEVGVVLSAVRAEDGTVMHGFIGGKRTESGKH